MRLLARSALALPYAAKLLAESAPATGGSACASFAAAWIGLQDMGPIFRLTDRIGEEECALAA